MRILQWPVDERQLVRMAKTVLDQAFLPALQFKERDVHRDDPSLADAKTVQKPVVSYHACLIPN